MLFFIPPQYFPRTAQKKILHIHVVSKVISQIYFTNLLRNFSYVCFDSYLIPGSNFLFATYFFLLVKVFIWDIIWTALITWFFLSALPWRNFRYRPIIFIFFIFLFPLKLFSLKILKILKFLENYQFLGFVFFVLKR